jgi:hypothetical protein
MKIANKNILTAIFLGAALTTTLGTFYSCKPGEEEPNPCELTCQNSGELIIVEDYCYCECPQGFEGDECEIAPE